MNFKIADFKVINKVANVLAINVNSKVFDGKVEGTLTLTYENVDVPLAPWGINEVIYSEFISISVLSTDNLEVVVKAAAAQQLGVTFL